MHDFPRNNGGIRVDLTWSRSMEFPLVAEAASNHQGQRDTCDLVGLEL